MIEFAQLQQNAKQLARCFAHACGQQHTGCFSFFSEVAPKQAALDDARTISLLAQSLDETYELISYIREMKQEPYLTLNEFNDFRAKVLVGMYLLKWSQYNTTREHSRYKSLIDLFQTHLGVRSVGEVDKAFFDSCLNDLSYYCTFVYERREQKTYVVLNNRLGATIQKDIHEIKQTSLHHDSLSWFGIYRGIMDSLGFNMY